MTTNQIQKVNHTDSLAAKLIRNIFQRSYKVEAELVGVEDFPPLNRTIEQFVNSKTVFFGLYKNNELAGLIEIEFQNDLLDICSLVVDPKYFRQGVAGELLDFVLDKFQPKESIVETASVNNPAISLYNKKGFEIVKHWMTSIQIEKVKLIRRSH